MDTYDMHDGEKVKAWIRANGPSLLLGIVLGIGILLGFEWWKGHQQGTAQDASALFTQLLVQQQQGNVKSVRATADNLMKAYSGTPYAGKAALIAARASFETGDVAGAQSYLQWAIDEGREDATRQAARVQLARILLDQGKLDEALQAIAVHQQAGFQSEYAELRGDVLVKKGDLSAAQAAYRAALEREAPGSPRARLLQMKLDDLGPEQNS